MLPATADIDVTGGAGSATLDAIAGIDVVDGSVTLTPSTDHATIALTGAAAAPVNQDPSTSSDRQAPRPVAVPAAPAPAPASAPSMSAPSHGGPSATVQAADGVTANGTGVRAAGREHHSAASPPSSAGGSSNETDGRSCR